MSAAAPTGGQTVYCVLCLYRKKEYKTALYAVLHSPVQTDITNQNFTGLAERYFLTIRAILKIIA